MSRHYRPLPDWCGIAPLWPTTRVVFGSGPTSFKVGFTRAELLTIARMLVGFLEARDAAETGIREWVAGRLKAGIYHQNIEVEVKWALGDAPFSSSYPGIVGLRKILGGHGLGPDAHDFVREVVEMQLNDRTNP